MHAFINLLITLASTTKAHTFCHVNRRGWVSLVSLLDRERGLSSLQVLYSATIKTVSGVSLVLETRCSTSGVAISHLV